MTLFDASVAKRGLTIIVVAPIVIYLCTDPKIVTFLVWFLTFVAMLEWTAMKRHLKVVLLSPLASDIRMHRQEPTTQQQQLSSDSDTDALLPLHLPPFPQKEFPYPVAKTNNFIRVKCFLCSLIAPCAYIGPHLFFMATTMYFFFWVVMTLTFQNKSEITAVRARQRMVRSRKNSSADLNQQRSLTPSPPSTPPTAALNNSSLAVDWENHPADAFNLYELDIIANMPITDVFLSFCLEYFGFVWITGLSCGLLLGASGPRGHVCGLVILVSNWANDIAALVIGKSLKGRTRPLYPRISPNKSLEGAVAGILANAVAAPIGMWMWPGAVELGWPFDTYIHPLMFAFFCGLIFGCLGVVGDLLQSLFKRTARIKDTGTIFPGHGGVLDRIDGLLLTYPPGYWLLWAFMAL